jgi:peptidoglycan/LPS O-acetylase OafA/YrhL
MPEPVSDSQRYLPGLDGLRALAVGAVVAYHMDLGWAQGGLLGVGVFFTLSGYLITDLLLGQYERTGGLQLADFWLRRARRLLPALFVMLTVVVAWVTLLDRSLLPAVRGAVGASAVYVTNWWLIAQHSSYFAQFAPPSPVDHLWSLAVEEQFYLIWPWLLWLGLRWTRTGAGSYRRLAAASLLLAAASAVAMALLYRPGYDPTRVYDGTDTRAFALLIGAALAFVWPTRRLPVRVEGRARWVLEGAGFAGLTVFAVLVWRTSEYSAFLYRGGLVLLSFATALMVAAAASPASWFGRILGGESLRWIGVRSYGIYLWHFPIIVLTTPAGGGDTPSRRVLQLAAIIGCAAVSWRYVEEPIRRGGLSKWWAQIRGNGWRLGAPGRQTRIAVAASVPVLVLASCGMSGVVHPGSVDPAPVTQPATDPAPVTQAATASASAASLRSPSTPTASSRPQSTATASAAASTPRQAAADPDRTSCRSVVHIGDSTSDGLISPEYLPDPRDRIDARYAQVGVTTFIPEISGARSIVETYQGYPNAATVAQQLIQQGYHGCWVLALGTNDTANVAVGSPVGLAARIREMMSLIGNQPVMWVNVRSLLSYGPYSENNMLAWDEALLQACASYPNMRVYDWASAVNDSWFISDGIHYNSAGYAARAYLIARALADAFPDQGGARQPASCLVH